MSQRLSVVGAVAGPPFDPLTWSGGSRSLFRALGRQATLVGAVDLTGPALAQRMAKVAAFRPDRAAWRERYYLSGVSRWVESRIGRRRIAAVGGAPDALVQIGAWHDLTGARLPRSVLRCSYHDGNIAVSLRRTDGALDPRSAHVRRVRRFERRTYDRLDVIFTMSEWLRRSFIEDFEQDPSKVVTVGAGANLDQMPPVPVRDWAVPVILFVGREFARKGGQELLAAFAQVRADHPHAVLRIVGPSLAPPPQPGVEFVGRVLRSGPQGDAEMARHYAEATLFAMPSLFEPFGYAFLEAMAFGLPCVGSTACAMPEIIADAQTGRVVPPGDAGALARAISGLLADPARLAAMGAAGRRRVEEGFTWDLVARRMVDAIAARLP